MNNNDQLLKLALIFVISILSFMIGTFVGKLGNQYFPQKDTKAVSVELAQGRLQEATLDCKDQNKNLKDFRYDFKTGSYDYVCEERK